MKHRLVLLFLLFICCSLHAQTIRDIFLALPDRYMPELNKAAKDSLLHFNTYTFPGGDSIETMICTYSSETDDHMVIEYGYTTGQNSFMVFQLRKLAGAGGVPLIIFARYGGMSRLFHQKGLFVFNYNTVTNTLTENKTLSLPEVIPVRDFFKPGTPDATLKEHERSVNTSYDLRPSGFDAIEYLAYPQEQIEYDLLETEVIRFTWDGTAFKRSVGER